MDVPWFLILLITVSICTIVLFTIVLGLIIFDYCVDYRRNKKNITTEQLNEVDKTHVAGDITKPTVPFSFSRWQALDYIDIVAENPQKYIIAPAAKIRKQKYIPDSLRVRDKCFALMHVKKGIVHLCLRLSAQDAKDTIDQYSLASYAKFPKGGWVNVIANRASFSSKEQIFALLDMAYNFVVDKYYKDIKESSLSIHKLPK